MQVAVSLCVTAVWEAVGKSRGAGKCLRIGLSTKESTQPGGIQVSSVFPLILHDEPFHRPNAVVPFYDLFVSCS